MAYGVKLWTRDTFALVGTDEFLFKDLPEELKHLGELRRAFGKGYIEKVRTDGERATTWRMTAKAQRAQRRSA